METKHFAVTISYIQDILSYLIKIGNTSLPPEDQRTGLYLTIMDANTGQVLLVIPHGEIPLDKHGKYLNLSLEKAKRLFDHPEHTTSAQSKDEKNNKFPGAVKGIECIYSVSGQMSDIDEGISLALFSVLEPSDIDFTQPEKNYNKVSHILKTVCHNNKKAHDFLIAMDKRY